MKILFLGTGAADWNILEHREMEGFRRNASALIDGQLLIDPGPNVLDALKTFKIDPSNIKYIINTHKHCDHYCEETLSRLKNAAFYEFDFNDTKTFGKYSVTALKGNHSTCDKVTHFIISDSEKNLFYGLDGAWLLYKEVEAIKQTSIDYAVLDATIGNISGDYRIFEHNNLNMVLEMKNTLAPYIKRFCISHMARTLHESHSLLENQMKEHGVEVAFDGYETEI